MSLLFFIEKNFLVLFSLNTKMKNLEIPIFPLNGAVLFLNTNLPLNIFEDT